MPEDTPQRSVRNVDRRELMRRMGASGSVAVVAGLAGCNQGNPTDDGSDPGGGDDSPDDGSTGQGGGEPIDDTFTTKVQNVPNDIQYNRYNGYNKSAEVQQVIFDPLAKYSKAEGEWVPGIVTDWTLDGDTLTVDVSDEHTWHNGDPVRARDLATQWKLDLHIGTGIEEYVSAVSASGDGSVELTLNSDTINQDILYLNLLKDRLEVKHAEFAPKLTNLEEASTEEEVQKAKKALAKDWRLKDPTGNGPFAFEDADSQRVLTVKFDDYPTADDINFSKYEFTYLASNQKRWQALMNDAIDGDSHLGITQEVLGQMPDHVDLIRPPGKGGTSLWFQHKKDTVVSDPRVRQAIVYVLNGDLLGQNSTMNYQHVPETMNTGMMPTQVGNWLSGDTLDGFTDYGVDEDTAQQRATDLLEDAGFSKDGGTWTTPGGSAFELPVTTFTGWWGLQGRTVVGQLKQFGIEAQLVGAGFGEFFDKLYGSGDFVAAIGGYSGDHPYVSVGETLFNGGSPDSVYAKQEYEVPMPVGDPDGSTETVDVMALTEELLNTRDEATVSELTTKLSWVYNQTLPRVPHLVGTGMTFLTSDEWEYPDPDDPDMKLLYPTYWLLRVGKLNAKTK